MKSSRRASERGSALIFSIVVFSGLLLMLLYFSGALTTGHKSTKHFSLAAELAQTMVTLANILDVTKTLTASGGVCGYAPTDIDTGSPLVAVLAPKDKWNNDIGIVDAGTKITRIGSWSFKFGCIFSAVCSGSGLGVLAAIPVGGAFKIDPLTKAVLSWRPVTSIIGNFMTPSMAPLDTPGRSIPRLGIFCPVS
jgi:hypothetical protein